MRTRSLSALAAMAVAIGLAGFVATGCGLDAAGGIVDPNEGPDSSGGPGKNSVVPAQGDEAQAQISMLLRISERPTS